MMWYEPFANPGEWALSRKNNITELVTHWKYCKYNPAVLKPFLSSGDYDNLCMIAYLYSKSLSTKEQNKDLIKMCFDTLTKCIDSHIEWKYNKSVNDETGPVVFNEFYHKVLEMALAMDAEGAIVTDKIIFNYLDIDDELKDQFVTAIIHMYAITFGIYTDKEQDAMVDFNHAHSVIKEIINDINRNGSHKNCVFDDHPTQFKEFVYDVITHDCHKYKNNKDGCIFCSIFNMLVDYFEKSKNYKTVSAVMPNVTKDIVDDIYGTLKNVLDTSDEGNYATTAAMIMHSGYSKEDLCKVTKLCINNLNYFNPGVCLDKSCEEAIIKGIMEYKPANELSGIYDVDHELTILEGITIGSFALEASNDDDDEDEEMYSSRRGSSSTKDNEDNSKYKFDEEGYRIKKPKRDFDSEFRKFKSNADKVTTSIDKVAASIKNAALGTSAQRGDRKVLKTDSLTKILARLFATIAVFHVNKFLGVLMIIVRLVNSGKVAERERVKLITEIKNEIAIIDEQINGGGVESQEARTNLLRTKQNLQDAYNKLRMNKPKYMTDGAKQAVQDLRNKNKI